MADKGKEAYRKAVAPLAGSVDRNLQDAAKLLAGLVAPLAGSVDRNIIG